MKYTPGPWSYSPAVPNRSFTAQVWDSTGQALATMDTVDDEATANARLIAAAPELLQAIEMCLNAADRKRKRIAAEFARSIIKKATE